MKPIPNDEDRLWEQHLFREEPDADFTLVVMRKLEGVSMESAEHGNPITKKASKSHWMRRTGIAAAAVVILVGGAWFAFDHTSAPEQPSVNAVNHPPLPNIPVPEELKYSYLADDYKRLKPFGLVVNPNIQIEDKGYTLKIKDVLVDRSQIVMTMQQKMPDGSGLAALTPEMGRIHVTDDQGLQVATLIRDTRANSSTVERFVFQLHDNIPDQVVVRGELGHLNMGYYNFETKSYEDKDVTVDWSFQFNIDMTRVKSLAVESTMDNTYTTPEGLKLDMTQLVRTPNGTRLDLNVSLDDGLRAKVDEDWANYMDLIYHLEIPETNEYRIFNGSRPNARQAKFRLRDLSGLMDGGPLKLSETWDPAFVTVDAKSIRFVLDGYTLPVKEEKSVEVDLDNMRKDMKDTSKHYTLVQFEQFGDQIVLYDFNYRPVEQSFNPPKGSFEGNSSLVLEGNGRFRNAFNGDQWVAIDSQGTEYPVEVMGTPDKPDNNEENVVNDLKLVIRGFYKEDGTKLTLKRTVVNREYRDVNWEVDLPSYTSLPWQK